MKWIPMSERLPEERQDVYVTVFWDDYGDTITAYGMRTQFGWLLWNTAEGELLKGYKVKAWMPLPQPYKADRKTENSSEKPNNCEHITEDGVTCARYPACDDCPDNPLNKVKGSKRLLKGSEQTDCQTCKWWSSYGYCVHRECKGYEPQTERSSE